MALRWNRSVCTAMICFGVWFTLSAHGFASDTTHSTIDFGRTAQNTPNTVTVQQRGKAPAVTKPVLQTKPTKQAKQTRQTKTAADEPKPSEKSAVGKKLSEGPQIKVGLFRTQHPIRLTVKGNILVRDGVSGRELQKLTAGNTVQVQVKNGKIILDQTPLNISLLEFAASSAKERENILLAADGKPYRGSLLLKLSGNEISVINELPLDAYLYGVVPEEMPAAWPLEALKAQTVAARTFAVFHGGRHIRDGYDICADTHCQVYGGAAAEKPASTAAVDATRGMVLYSAGKPIDAFFHTDSGGMTENSEDVWGTYYPYLRAAREDNLKTGPWQVKYTVPELQLKLNEAGYMPGILKKIELTPLVIGHAAADRSASGRVQIIKFFGTKGVSTLTGNELRKLLGLKSTLFDVRLEKPAIQSIKADMGFQKKKISVNLPDEEERNLSLDKIHVLSGREGESIVIFGYGWGHGLGLSQWGAKDLAAHMGYQEILAHYYQNTELKKLY